MAYGIATWSRTPDTWEHEFDLSTLTSKTLIKHKGNYYTYDGFRWENVGASVSQMLIQQKGMDENFSEDVQTKTMTRSMTFVTNTANGKVFEAKIDTSIENIATITM